MEESQGLKWRDWLKEMAIFQVRDDSGLGQGGGSGNLIRCDQIQVIFQS